MSERSVDYDACHCGNLVAVVADPPMFETLGPAPRTLCIDCLWVRCDAFPGACDTHVFPPGESTEEAPLTDNPVIRYADMPGGPEFDEFIAHNARIHFEAMGDAQWWIGIEVDGRMWHINCGAVNSRAKGYAICEEDA